MLITDAMLAAAVKKAVEVKLLPKSGFIDVIAENWRKVKSVVEAALAEADESPSRAVPCEDHPVLDVIADRLSPEFGWPTEGVRRERDSVEFRDTVLNRRFEILVRPIPDAEDRP